MSDNPYAPPAAETTQERPSLWVMQARVVAVLLAMQGILEVSVSLLLLYQWQKSVVSVAWVLMALVPGVIKVVAGIYNFQFRKRRWGLTAIALSPLSILTIICFPTAILLMTYGLFVYLSRDVKRAFE